MIRELRPHQLSGLVRTQSYLDRLITLVLPDIDTPLMFETGVLIALARIVQPRRYFEFGTFRGVEALNVAANVPASVRLYTLDLDKEAAAELQQHPNDAKLTAKHFASEDRLAFYDTPYAERIQVLKGDSRRFDFTPYHGAIDMIYVDGGHDLDTVRSDTENALRMLAGGSMSCVVWHDYGNPHYAELTSYLESLSEERLVFHVAGTMMCFHFHDPPADVLAALGVRSRGSAG